jgi:hypothetical protein
MCYKLFMSAKVRSSINVGARPQAILKRVLDRYSVGGGVGAGEDLGEFGAGDFVFVEEGLSAAA